MQKFNLYLDFIRDLYKVDKDTFLPLHAPVFKGHEKEYLIDTIDSTFVSSVGVYVNKFEDKLQDLLHSPFAVACTNGTCALQIALNVAGVGHNDYVITQALSFVATSNAISHVGAKPIFLDIDINTLGLSAKALDSFLDSRSYQKDGFCYLKDDNKKIAACVPMHTFGFACEIDKIVDICHKHNILVVEDAAEALGSKYQGRALGTFGDLGCLSFNGNKIITTGGGGAILTNNENYAKHAKRLTTTAKVPHQYKFFHDEIAYNFRMPNLNAALGCAQLESLPSFLENKRQTAMAYKGFFKDSDCLFVDEVQNCKANFWLCAIKFNDIKMRDSFLEYSNSHNVMTRPCWEMTHTLPMYKDCIKDSLKNTTFIYERLVNIPSGVRCCD